MLASFKTQKYTFEDFTLTYSVILLLPLYILVLSDCCHSFVSWCGQTGSTLYTKTLTCPALSHIDHSRTLSRWVWINWSDWDTAEIHKLSRTVVFERECGVIGTRLKYTNYLGRLCLSEESCPMWNPRDARLLESHWKNKCFLLRLPHYSYKWDLAGNLESTRDMAKVNMNFSIVRQDKSQLN